MAEQRYQAVLAVIKDGRTIKDVAGQCPTACEQMATGSELIARLNSGDETPSGPRWITVRTDKDTVVTPTTSARLDGAQPVPGELELQRPQPQTQQHGRDRQRPGQHDQHQPGEDQHQPRDEQHDASQGAGRPMFKRTVFVIGKDGKVAYSDTKFGALSQDAYDKLASAIKTARAN